MEASMLTNLHKAALKTAAQGFEDRVDGVLVRESYHGQVGRNTARMLLFFNDVEAGFVDYVVPFSIFKDPYEVYNLYFATTEPFDFPGVTWESNPYRDDDAPAVYHPTTKTLEEAISFFKQHMQKDQILKATPSAA